MGQTSSLPHLQPLRSPRGRRPSPPPPWTTAWWRALEEGPVSWLLPWQWQPWNLTTGAQEWGWGVDAGHGGGREEGPEAQES